VFVCDLGTRFAHVGAVEGHHLPDVDPPEHVALVVHPLEERAIALVGLLALALEPVQEVDSREELGQSARRVVAEGGRGVTVSPGRQPASSLTS